MTAIPTLTLDEVTQGIQEESNSFIVKKILESILNDYMDLQYGNETPYTTGKQILPTDVTIQDLESAIANENTKKIFKDVFVKILEIEKNEEALPINNNYDGLWNPRFKPVLVLLRPKK